MLAGAVIGFVEAAGADSERRMLRRPEPVVWFQAREPDETRRPAGLWFLERFRGWRQRLSPN